MRRYKMRGGFEGYNWIYIILALIPVVVVAIIMGVELAVKPNVPSSVSPNTSPFDSNLSLTITGVYPNTSIGTPTSLSVYTLPNTKSAYGNSKILYQLTLYAVYPPDNTPEETYNFSSSQPYEYDPTGKTFELTIPPQKDGMYTAVIQACIYDYNGIVSHRGPVAGYTYRFP